jgi:hypothetical protein
MYWRDQVEILDPISSQISVYITGSESKERNIQQQQQQPSLLVPRKEIYKYKSSL